MNTSHEHFMARALELAKIAYEKKEVPVGAVVVLENEIVGEGHNQPISACDPTAHAEIVALRAAAQHLGNYRLPGCVLYSTLEPCVQCVGATIHARIETVVFGASDLKAGAAGGKFELLGSPDFNHVVKIERGVMAGECGDILKTFFQARRRS